MTPLAPTRQRSRADLFHSRLQAWSKTMFVKLLANLRDGQITVRDKSESRTLGEHQQLRAAITVHDSAFYPRVLFGGSIGAGEAYVEGLWEADCLTTLARIMVRNMDLLDRMEQGLAWLLWPYQRLRHLQRNNHREGAKKNILAHYDLGNDLYRAFLDPEMMYSAAIYPEEASNLEEAARFKLDYICRRLDLQPQDRVIEIGGGWGGFAIHAAARYGCHVTTTTISDAQFREARQRIARAGLGHRITLLQKDYRDLHGRYDKLVSIEMIEAVGHRHLPEFFRKCGSLLRPDGLMLLQAITIADQKYSQYVRGVDFIQRHIFPGGCVPSNTRMLALITAESDLVVRSIEDFGFDYARTLRDWRTRFLSAFKELKKGGYDERFKRLWEFYLAYCEGGFRERALSVVQLMATRPHNRAALRRL
ncbi:MAG: cyclopropane-fatty-acyl-phospholipid synthase family protein [Desulfobacterales bacterium]